MSHNQSAYKKYCSQNKMPLFFNPEFLDALQLNWGVKKINSTNGEEYFFVYQVEKKWNFKIIRNPVITPYFGICTTFDCNKIIRFNLEEIESLLPKCDELHLLFLPNISIEGNKSDVHVQKSHTSILDLKTNKNYYDQYKPALKRQIKKAQKNISIVESQDFELFYTLHTKTFLKQDTKPSVSFDKMKEVWIALQKCNSGKIFLAQDEMQNIHAAVILAYDCNMSYYLAGGTDAKFYGSGAMSLLMNSLIQWSENIGLTYFDFEGSALQNIQRYFDNFSPIKCIQQSVFHQKSYWLKTLKKIRK